jgi:methionyl-tRNA formyltransferase
MRENMAANSNEIVFFGTDDFAVMVLEKLLECSVKVTLVITTPPRPAGRGRKESKSDVALFAESHALYLQELENLRDASTQALLEQHKNALFVVVSYGKILPENLLSLSCYPVINLHPSLLPRWRGPSPMQTTLLMGDTMTGVSIIKVTPEVDAGAILAQKEYAVNDQINALELKELLADEGGMLLADTITQLGTGKTVFSEQDHASATYTKKFTKEDGIIDWNDANLVIHNKIRALVEWPTAVTSFNGKKVKVFLSSLARCNDQSRVPGEVIEIDDAGFIRVMTGEGALDIFEVQGEGKKRMNAYQFSLGARIQVGGRFGGASC